MKGVTNCKPYLKVPDTFYEILDSLIFFFFLRISALPNVLIHLFKIHMERESKFTFFEGVTGRAGNRIQMLAWSAVTGICCSQGPSLPCAS